MNDWKTSFFIAYKSITRGNRSTLILMIFILSLSFVNMLFISGVLAGIWNSELNAVVNFLAGDITISPQQQPVVKQFIPNEQELRAELQTIPGIEASVRHYLLAGSLSFDKDKNGQYKSLSGVIIGIDPNEEPKVFTAQNLMFAGDRLSPDNTNQIVLSSAIAGGYKSISRSNTDLGGARVGDKIQITYSNGVMRTYTVEGIYNDVLGINQTFITAKEAESVLGVSNEASQILLKTDLTKNPVNYYQNRVQVMAPSLMVQNYTSNLGSIASFEKALNLISDIVSAISVLVAAVTIFVLIYVNAINKRRQIGILKAIGIKQKIIVNAYILQSLFYTFCGLFIGLILVFGILDPILTIHPVTLITGAIDLALFYTTFGVAIGIVSFVIAGYLAGRIPARIVAKQEILKAIWG